MRQRGLRQPPSFAKGRRLEMDAVLRKSGPSTNERIDHVHASVDEIGTVSRGDRQTVDGRSRRDEAILNRHAFPGCAQTRQQFRPFQARVCVPGQTVETLDPLVEPAFQGGPLPSLGKDQNPESQFAQTCWNSRW